MHEDEATDAASGDQEEYSEGAVRKEYGTAFPAFFLISDDQDSDTHDSDVEPETSSTTECEEVEKSSTRKYFGTCFPFSFEEMY